MQYRKLRASKIFNGFDWLADNQVLILNENGVIDNIVPVNEAGDNIEHLEGILVPGFINCHCHLELSHLKNAVPVHTGLVNFLITVIKNRTADKEEIAGHMAAAEKEMFNNGIVAVADVCNTSQAIEIKRKSSLLWHNLIEVINLHDENLEKQLTHFNLVLDQYKTLDLSRATTSLTPHAPYSVSGDTFKALNIATANSIISIHNQESFAENELFEKGEGEFLKLFDALGQSGSPLKIGGKTSLKTWLPYFNNGQTILLVHNTFISEEDILFVKEYSKNNNVEMIYCLCPNANLYIENTLPPVNLLLKHNCKIVLGTDSYSSNWQLNIASEIKTLCDHFSHLPISTILQWATANGAEVLHQNAVLGSLRAGKKPGIVLLETDPLNSQSITGNCHRIT
jgi:cytosine/adenosine deaminase-related metal-dependent hydrolase